MELLKKPTPHPLKKFFEERGITQLALAHYLGLSHGQVSLYLRGWRPMPRHHEEKLEKLAEQLREESQNGR